MKERKKVKEERWLIQIPKDAVKRALEEYFGLEDVMFMKEGEESEDLEDCEFMFIEGDIKNKKGFGKK